MAAVVLMVAFFALALALAVALAVLGIAAFTALGDIRPGRAMVLVALLGAACLFAAVLILWSMLPRIDRFEAPGPELRESDAPRLFAMIREIAARAGQQPPAHVYLVEDVNAFVAERGGWMGLGSRRVMGLGLPLLEILCVDELRAVIAHEFGHFHGGDTKLGPWIYKTRAAMGRIIVNLRDTITADNVDNAWLAMAIGFVRATRYPFEWFGAGYMRITQAISRSQEYGADALAARLCGSDVCASALRRVTPGAIGYSAFRTHEVAGFLDRGFRPPLLDGFRRFLDDDAVRKGLNELAEQPESADPYDSHPPTELRVAAVQRLACPSPSIKDERRATVLLDDLADLEERLFAGEDGRPAPKLIPWDGLIDDVLVPQWRQSLVTHHRLLEGLTCASLPLATDDIRRRFHRGRGLDISSASADEVVHMFIQLVAIDMSLALLERGFVGRNVPGQPLRFERHGDVVEPAAELFAAQGGETSPEAWRQRLAQLGLLHHDLGQIEAFRQQVAEPEAIWG